jgi:LysR family cys regulon transcriptional activator
VDLGKTAEQRLLGEAAVPTLGGARGKVHAYQGTAVVVTYHPSFTGRTRIDSAFAQKKLTPRIALEAIDSDVIKTYVRLGLGIGIVAEMAVRDDGSNGDLAVRPLGTLFGQNLARVAFKRGAYLRNFVYRFAELLSPDRLDRNLIAKAMSGQGNDYEM